MVTQERRAFPRVAKPLPLKLNIASCDAVTHTVNISASGVYCKVDKEIPLMSRVRIMLMMPDLTKEDKPPKGIEVDGVVVRQHPVLIDGQTRHYDVAIFFENLSGKDKGTISNYISKKKG